MFKKKYSEFEEDGLESRRLHSEFSEADPAVSQFHGESVRRLVVGTNPNAAVGERLDVTNAEEFPDGGNECRVVVGPHDDGHAVRRMLGPQVLE